MINEIRNKIKDKKLLIKQLGYNNVNLGIKTLDSLLNSNTVSEWLYESGYDYKYSRSDFFIELCKLLDIKEDCVNKTFKEIKYIKNIRESRIVVKTNFKRDTESILMLALLAPSRVIKINKVDLQEAISSLTCDPKEASAFQVLKSEEEFIMDLINEHYINHDGKLEVFGIITGYEYVSKASNLHINERII